MLQIRRVLAPTLSRVIGSLRIEVVNDSRLCFAMQQNGVVPVQLLQLHNDGEAMLRDLDVRLELLPDLGSPWTARVAQIPAGATFNLQPALMLRPEVLAATAERFRANLRVEVRVCDVVLATLEREINVLAYNEWPGAASLPSLLAAFVLPNHPVLAPVLRAASARLAKATGNGALDGYQGRDPERVRAMAQAIYEEIQACGIAYVHPPASFEQNGQKVRTPEQVIGERLGTCLDLSLLYAACLEQAGLHALVPLVEGHAAAGLWLEPETFAEAAPADPLPLRKRIELDRIALIECTTLCTTQAQPFSVACSLGSKLVEAPAVDSLAQAAKAPRTFWFALDVAAARRVGIKPLPLRITSYQIAPDASPMPGPMILPLPPVRPLEPMPVLPVADTSDRLGRWQRKLLDLTLRNRLLNFVPTKRTIPLLTIDLPAFIAVLESDAEFQLVPGGVADIPADALGEYLQHELEGRRLCVPLAEEELERRQLEIFRATRTANEEGGVNTLFLAVGFLRWYETPSSKEPRRAPLMLMPLRIERVSIAEGFVVALADEAARLNDTLVQKLQQDFQLSIEGLDGEENEEGEEDADGLDPANVLDLFRRAIVNVPRWEVEAVVCIGNFSFAKYLMWSDLQDRREEMLAHPFLNHLIATPQNAFAQPADWPVDRELDQQDPATLFCPKDADSSQLVAVRAAATGKSFVLEGPPGTGKSQTITNLIAQSLAQGQRVLFVAEKRAALEVVQRRLGEVSLAPFCLELHSGKGTRKDVIRQLGVTLAQARIAEPQAWGQRAAELQAARTRLNELVMALHRQRSQGGSLFLAIGVAVEGKDLPFVEGIDIDVDVAARARQLAQLAELAAMALPLGTIREHPFFGVRCNVWLPELGKRVQRNLAAAAAAIQALKEAAAKVRAMLALPVRDGVSRAEVGSLADLAGLLLAGGLSRELLAAPDFAVRSTRLKEWCAVGRSYSALLADLTLRWRTAFLQLDVRSLREQIELHAKRFALLRFWALRKVRRALTEVVVGGRLPAVEVLFRDLAAAEDLCAMQRQLEGVAVDGRLWLLALWRGVDTDWNAVTLLLQRCAHVRGLIAVVAGVEGTAPSTVALFARCAEVAELLGPHQVELADLLRAQEAATQACRVLAESLQWDHDAAFGDGAADGYFPFASDRIARCEAAIPRLREWCAFQREAQAAGTVGLKPLVAALERGEVEAAKLSAVYERSFAESLLNRTLAAEPLLGSFRGLDHERLIQRFRALDRELIELSAQVVRARLCARLPLQGSANAPSSELGVLLRELKKQRRHMSPRQLFQRMPNLLRNLAPCLLMSPLTVAQVLGRGVLPFDLVVFDEASQVPIWDAVGAISRGKSLLVVGDSKQLPPTSFFQRMAGEDPVSEGEPDHVEDLESVLDECVAVGLERLYLRWHYRSQHESLITFSNHHYYENRLFTFPAPDRSGALGVRLVPVNGVYDRSRSQQNRIEAEALVLVLVQRLRDLQGKHLSFGVVTFSQPQQTLVEDLLEKARQQYPEIEHHFAAPLEPVFIKNLENVQGDERDVMLFSICYGPDAAGRVHMNFGPLNQQGGERRLNVAVTRARRELLVFSSLRAEQIELQRTQSLGVRHLRAFLDYAARGVQAITEAVTLDPSASCESPFERSVKQALAALGHEVHSQVGCSGYRIDLAVVDPRAQGRYLLGIECDGATYHSAATARDRDRLRQGVLERLGWQLCRIWSSDWWLDAAGELARVEVALQQARLSRQVPSSVEKALPPVLLPTPLVPAAIARAVAAESLPHYRACVLPLRGDAMALMVAANDLQVQSLIESVLLAEAPIVFELLARRIAGSYRIGRMTERVRRRIRELLCDVQRSKEDVIWRRDQDMASFASFRGSPPGDSARDAGLLPVAEIANAMRWILQQNGSLVEKDLLREAAMTFGFTRVGNSVREAMQGGLALLLQRGIGVQDESVIRLS